MKYIVVHSGARDQYKLAEALYKNGKLGFLVTDDIWLRKKYRKIFPKSVVRVPIISMFLAIILKIHNFGERMQQYNNSILGRFAGKLSKKNNMPLLALQEYAYHAFKYSEVRPRIVFQYHPQANANKLIFEEENKKHPESDSFKNEISIYTPQKLKEAADELKATDYFIGASSFTKKTLIDNGVDEESVFVAPYGVNTSRYPFAERSVPNIVSFVFVGSFVERKGIYYLLNAAKRLEEEGLPFKLELTGRAPTDMSFFDSFGLKSLTVHYNLSHEALIDLLHSSDVFVFPSLFEGFAFVIIEAMATGLPVITTPRTIGPDVIENGNEGFIINPSDVEALYEKMKFFILNPIDCIEMGKNASRKAQNLTWDNFEKKIINAIEIVEQDL